MSDKETFNNIIESYPQLSSYICFGRLIKGKGFNRTKILRLFNQLVDKTDYDQSQKSFLVDLMVKYGSTDTPTFNNKG